MMTILRHVFTSFIFSFILTITIILVTFFVFPLEDWRLLLTEKFLNVPYLLLLFCISLVLSTIVGIIISLFWKQRLQYIERQLHYIVNGQTLTMDENYKELDKVDTQIEEVDKKIKQQVEKAQHAATERAKEREKSLQEVVAQERNRLARDLHDSVSQQLFAASMMMSAMNESTEREENSINHQIKMVEKMIHQSQLEMRALLLHLRPAALKGKALQEGITDLLTEFTNRIPIQVDWKIESFSIEKGVEDQLFRIVQEAISNTLRHAEAKSIHVMLIKRDYWIILRIVDDGKGFDLNKTMTSSYGLKNMKERAYELGGSFKVISLPDQGTRVEVKIPIVKKEEKA